MLLRVNQAFPDFGTNNSGFSFSPVKDQEWFHLLKSVILFLQNNVSAN